VALWCKALHRSASCATRDRGSSPGSVAASRDQEPHGSVHNRPRVVRVRGWTPGMFLFHRALATTVASWAQCTLTRSPGVQCFHRYIGAAGVRVKQTLCQEAVRLGLVVVQRTHGSWPSPIWVRTGFAAMGQNCELPIGEKGVKKTFKKLNTVYIILVKSFRTATHSRVFLYFTIFYIVE
jgi:hypothetical protein